jgi:hypothetical protein
MGNLINSEECSETADGVARNGTEHSKKIAL